MYNHLPNKIWETNAFTLPLLFVGSQRSPVVILEAIWSTSLFEQLENPPWLEVYQWKMALIQEKLNLFPMENRQFPSFQSLKWRYYMRSIRPFLWAVHAFSRMDSYSLGRIPVRIASLSKRVWWFKKTVCTLPRRWLLGEMGIRIIWLNTTQFCFAFTLCFFLGREAAFVNWTQLTCIYLPTLHTGLPSHQKRTSSGFWKISGFQWTIAGGKQCHRTSRTSPDNGCLLRGEWLPNLL